MSIDLGAECDAAAHVRIRYEGTLNEEILISFCGCQMAVSWNRQEQGWDVFYNLPDRSSHDFTGDENELRAMVAAFSTGGIA